jgi:hypothetical protein
MGATPRVAATASELGIDLTKVKGTGAGGRVSVADVRAAAGLDPAPAPAPAQRVAAAGTSTGTYVKRAGGVNGKLPYSSEWSRGVTVQLDPYSRNPMADDLQQANPTLYAIALRDGPVPTLFETGDLPIVCASGLDPQLLLNAPAYCRHGIAEAPTLAQASTMLQDSATHPDDHLPSYGLSGYRVRMQRWASGADNASKLPPSWSA